MKIALANNGIWIKRDNKNDVHIHAGGPESPDAMVLAINDEAVYNGKGCCPLALCMKADKSYLQIRHENNETTFHDVDPVVLDALLRGVLTTLAASVAAK